MQTTRITGFPIQKIPYAQKDEEWRKLCVEYVIQRGFMFTSPMRNKMQVNYDLYNGKLDETDLKYVTNPYDIEKGQEAFPANIHNINRIYSRVNSLIGDEIARGDRFIIAQSNPGIASSIIEQKAEELKMAIKSMVAQGIDPNAVQEEKIPTFKELEEKFKTYKDLGEKAANIILNKQKKELEIDDHLIEAFKDLLIAGEEIHYIGVEDGSVLYERCNPKYCAYDRTQHIRKISKGSWFYREIRMTIADAYDKLGHLAKDKEEFLDAMLKYSGYSNSSDIIKRNYTRVNFGQQTTDEYLSSELISVFHVTWTSYQQIGFLKTLDENKQPIEMIVDESYKPVDGEEIRWEWKKQVWEGYRAASGYYLGIRPTNYEDLPYVGGRINDANSTSVSLVDILKPLFYLYIIAWYRLELNMARDKGKILVMDATQIPKTLGFDMKRWMHYASVYGVMFVNPYEEGFDIKREGKAAAFNQFAILDASTMQQINGYIQLVDYLDRVMGQVCGISPQREASINNSELVGNVERSINQSANITEYIFKRHAQIKRDVLTTILNHTKLAWLESGYDESIDYIMDDLTRVYMETVPDEFYFNDHDVYVTDASKDRQDLEYLKEMAKASMQSGTKLWEIGEMLVSDSMSEIVSKLKAADALRTIQEQQAQQAQLETQKQIAEQQQAMIAEQNRIKEEDSIRKSDTAITVAQIQADVQMNSADELASENRQRLLELEREKADNDAILKARKQDELERSNREKEKIAKQKASAPKSTTNKK